MNLDLLSRLDAKFSEQFGGAPAESDQFVKRFFSPGRINLIGEHIDYCGGNVLPATIQFGTYVLARPNSSGTVTVASLNQPGEARFDPAGNLQRSNPVHWSDYVKGIFVEYHKLGFAAPGMEILIGGDIPGGGLSSSASLEVGVALVIEALGECHHSPDQFKNRQAISWLAQRAENNFVGVNCGIMDQGAIALGKANHALLMDCSDLSVQYIPVELGDYSLLIVNSCKERRLGESAYNQRCLEVEEGMRILQPRFRVSHLCEIAIEQLDEALALIVDPVIKKRVRHVITEQNRVTGATARLAEGDVAGFGVLLDASHRSLQQDYEVTGRELDSLIGIAQVQPGVLGARMMGAGFGGCGLVLLETSAIEDFSCAVGTAYKSETGLDAEFYPARIGSGAEEMQARS